MKQRAKLSIGVRATLLLAVALAITCGGCDAMAYILSKTFAPFVPEPAIRAQYELKGKSIVVLLDFEDPLLAEEHPRVQIDLARNICLKLDARKAIESYVEPRDLVILRQQEPDFDRWPISKVGRRCDADIVMHLNILEFRLKTSETSSVFQGRAEVGVSLVATTTGKQIWPELARPRLIQAEALPKPDVKNAADAERILTEGLADKISRLFYTHKTSELPLRSDVK
jgi:hypothetical protein